MDLLSLLNFIVLYTLLFTIIGCILFYLLYKYTINKFSNNYDNFIKILKNVDNNDLNFMNFGYWDDEYMSLTNANKKLCDFVIEQMEIKPDNKILDIGCGYGEQDFYWHEKYKYDIVALDISEKQIKHASTKAENNKSIKFIQGNATNLPFPDESFKNVICLESAFHYNPRNDFFKESYRVMENDSEIVIADIVLKKNHYGIMKSIFINFFKEILSVPESNLICVNTYVEQLEKAGFEVEKINISSKTFKPYFNHFSKNHHFKFYFYDKLVDIITNNIQHIPFEYYVFKCKKK